jgi:hypothetical protein
MMKAVQIVFVFLFSVSCSAVFAGEPGEIELIDGSVIHGEIVSFKEGVYTVRSEAIGSIEINESKIRAIRFTSQKTSREEAYSATKGSPRAESEALQDALLSNEEILPILLSLQNDPEIQGILNDPEIMDAVFAGDLQRLMSNPKFMELLNHPKVRRIQETFSE